MTSEEGLQTSSQSFESLEKDFQRVLQELAVDAGLKHFHLQFERLHRAWVASYENEQKLLKKCQELNQTIIDSAHNLIYRHVEPTSVPPDMQIISQELDKAYRIIEQFRDKEEHNKLKIQRLHEQIRQFRSVIDQETNDNVIELTQRFTEEKNRMANEIDLIKRELTQALEKAKDFESDKERLQAKVEYLKKRLDSVLSEPNKKENEPVNTYVETLKDENIK